MTVWLLPVAVAAVVLVPVVALVLRVAAEFSFLRAELARMGELRSAVVDLRSDAEIARDALRRGTSGH